MDDALATTIARHLATTRADVDAAAVERLTATIAAGLADAGQRWPDVEVDADALARHLAARVDASLTIDAGVASLEVADLALACACERGDPRAIAAFAATYRGVLRAAFARVSARGVDEEDLQQRLFQRLFVAEGERAPRIAGYSGRGPLGAWVKVAATRLRIDVERKRSDKERPLEDEDARLLDLASGDGELHFLKAHYRDRFKEAFQAALAALPPRERNLLRLTVVEGISATKIAALYNVDRATSKRWLVSARSQLLAGTRARLLAALKLGDEEFESLFRLIQSNLEVSMHRILEA
ncbi:MAG: sigma-70 family RNA polymerase sigma factor [Nannocystaceae bacterium]